VACRKVNQKTLAVQRCPNPSTVSQQIDRSKREAWYVTLNSPCQVREHAIPKTFWRVDGRQCAARHTGRSRKSSPKQHASRPCG
jgi:hypothetical protein